MTPPRRPTVLRRLRSIRGRLLAGIVAILALGLVGSFSATSLLLQDYLYDRDRRTLEESSRRVRDLLAAGPQTVDADQFGALLGPPLGAVVVGEDGAVVAASGSGDRAPATVAALTARRRPGTVVSLEPERRDDVDVLAVRIPSPGLRVTDFGSRAPIRTGAVVLTIDTGIDDGAVDRLLRSQGLVVLVTVLLAVLVSLLVLRVGLRPLSRMASAAEAIASGALRRRLPTAGGGPEVDQLATAVNRAFDAQSDAEEKIRAFAADASHELRTPLATISGWLDLYNQGSLRTPADVEAALGRVDAEVGRMRLLVEELSLLARLDAGRPLLADAVDVAALADGIVEDARVVSQDRRIDLDAAGPATVRGDEPRLAQVLRNLVGNAVQHTPADARVDVVVRATDDAVLVTVHDDGPGMTEAAVTHAFERFWRAESSRSRAYGGSGLGLPIVRAIVEAHGGSVSLTSSAGAGTSVVVRLPRGA
jgi:two-component system OmpR family sensor kinase